MAPLILTAAVGLCLPVEPANSADGATRETGRRPNVLFIIADDLNTSLGCYGNTVVRTPNFDRLAARAVRFDHAYCQYPQCNPSRTSLLSGRRPETTRVLDNDTWPRATLTKAVFLPEYFRQHGYFTARVGVVEHENMEKNIKWDVSERPSLKISRTKEERIVGLPTDKPDDQEEDGMIARRAVEILEQKHGRPFFIAAGFRRPHMPFVVPKKYFAMYPPDKIILPVGSDVGHSSIEETDRSTKDPWRDLNDSQRRQAIASYFACVSFIDAQVGVLLDAMDRLNLWDNTIVVATSDHGFHLGEHGGLWAKMTLFEEATRSPLIVAAPGKHANVASPRIVEHVDLYPTLAELCGLPVPDGLEGTSFVPLLDDPGRPWKRAAFTMVAPREREATGQCVRTERYRYIEWDGGRAGVRLFDHENDPREQVNLADVPEHAKTVAELHKVLCDGWKAAVPGR